MATRSDSEDLDNRVPLICLVLLRFSFLFPSMYMYGGNTNSLFSMVVPDGSLRSANNVRSQLNSIQLISAQQDRQ